MVQSPTSENVDEVIPTPPLVPEANLRFIQRNLGLAQEMMEVRAGNLARKRNLEGMTSSHSKNTFDALSDKDIIARASKLGVNIPDDDFDSVDILRELEVVRANLANKSKNMNDVVSVKPLLITNELGTKTGLDMQWLDHDETINE